MPSKFRIAGFTETESVVKEITSLEETNEFLKKYKVTWLDCIAPNQIEADELAKIFSFHKLTTDAYFHNPQRSKVEDYCCYFYALIKEIDYRKEVKGHKIAIYVGSNYIVTLREQASEHLDFLFQKITEKNQKVLTSGPDYVCYLIVDQIVDDYMPILDCIENEVDVIEKEILANASKETLRKIFKVKRDILMFRKIVWPMREVLMKFERDDLPFVTDKTKVYMRDVYDHIITITDLVETYRELASGIVEAYLTTLSNNINSVVKILTVIAALAVPATIVTSFYGMNGITFPDQSVLGSKNDYYFTLAIIIIPTILMLYFFRKKKWI